PPEKDMFCGPSIDFDSLEKKMRKMGSTLAAKSNELNVSVINMSGGDSVGDIKKFYAQLCNREMSDDDAKRYITAVKPFYSELGKANALIVQSGVFLQDPNLQEAFPIDCGDSLMPNRLRVGFAYEDELPFLPTGGINLTTPPHHFFN